MIVPTVSEFTSTVIVNRAKAPAAISPSEQVGAPLGSSAQPLVETRVTPAGSVSVTTTFCAVSGPLLDTSIVYVRLLPEITGSTLSVLLMLRSACEMTTVSAKSMLLSRFGSYSFAEATASLIRMSPLLADDSTSTTIVRVADSSTPREPTSHDEPTVSFDAVPFVADTENTSMSPNRSSDTSKPVAIDGPRFVTTIV